MRESQVEQHLVEQVKARGGLVRKLQWIGRSSAPDRLVGFPGRHALVETKRPGKDAEAAQAREHQRLRAVGFDVRVLATIEEVDRFVAEMTCAT